MAPEPETGAIDPRVLAFRDDAAAYCAFIDQFRAGAVSEPYTRLLQLLSALAASGVAIPFDSPDNEPNLEAGLTAEAWSEVARDVGDACASVSRALAEHHAGDEEAVTRAVMLWDDLGDIYRDLRKGLDLFAHGTPDCIAQAIWEWRFGYESHWGPHLVRVLQTVHEIRYLLYLP